MHKLEAARHEPPYCNRRPTSRPPNRSISFHSNRMEAFMNYLFQFGIILAMSFLGELLHELIPLPIPASIYGLVLMLLCLSLRLIRLHWVRDAAGFLLKIMPSLFIPAIVGLMALDRAALPILLPFLIITLVTTVIVMAATGKTAELVLRAGRRREK